MPVGRGSKELGRRRPARQSISPGGSEPQGCHRHHTVCGVCWLNERIRCAGRKCRRRHARRCHCRPPLRRGGPGKPPRALPAPRRHPPAPPRPPCARSALSLSPRKGLSAKGNCYYRLFVVTTIGRALGGAFSLTRGPERVAYYISEAILFSF